MNFLYARVSTEEQQTRGWSLQGQESELRSICTGELEVYSDTASGSNTKRPGLQALLKRIASERGGTLYVWRADRLSRSACDFYSIIRRICARGFDLYFANPGLSWNDSSGRLVIGIQVCVAEYELSILKERTNLGLRQARAAGKHCGSAGFGFQHSEGHLILSIEEQKALAIIYRAIREGTSLRAIARMLNDQGVPTKKGGKKWYASTVRSVIQTTRNLLQIKDLI